MARKLKRRPQLSERDGVAGDPHQAIGQGMRREGLGRTGSIGCAP